MAPSETSGLPQHVAAILPATMDVDSGDRREFKCHSTLQQSSGFFYQQAFL